MARKSSGDLEFHVQCGGDSSTKIFTKFEDAAAQAISASISRDCDAIIDVITWSRAAAKKWGGEVAVEIYEADPEASVHQRLVIRAKDQSHVA